MQNVMILASSQRLTNEQMALLKAAVAQRTNAQNQQQQQFQQQQQQQMAQAQAQQLAQQQAAQAAQQGQQPSQQNATQAVQALQQRVHHIEALLSRPDVTDEQRVKMQAELESAKTNLQRVIKLLLAAHNQNGGSGWRWRRGRGSCRCSRAPTRASTAPLRLPTTSSREDSLSPQALHHFVNRPPQALPLFLPASRPRAALSTPRSPALPLPRSSPRSSSRLRMLRTPPCSLLNNRRTLNPSNKLKPNSRRKLKLRLSPTNKRCSKLNRCNTNSSKEEEESPNPPPATPLSSRKLLNQALRRPPTSLSAARDRLPSPPTSPCPTLLPKLSPLLDLPSPPVSPTRLQSLRRPLRGIRGWGRNRLLRRSGEGMLVVCWA
ncbi:hypothetical protein BCR35DRAFT_146103 [Leucosporidium creatinivorum]|uniref:Uncharacterized protein n=1 Tax=Leucosporidium creatinivorum TaxID=106004 RepID=A0A1Y2EQL7_9BASI|nr:hypothetical protein BCR35DRAFT_146103 [Leucosporidium creatinivorum]